MSIEPVMLSNHLIHCRPHLRLRSEERRVGKEWLTLSFWAPKSLQMVTVAMKLEDAYSLEGKL